jgi:phosphoglycolate phosphatase-like HAD superfamily hydrolase
VLGDERPAGWPGLSLADEAVMFGETPWDVKAVGEAGLPTLAIRTGVFATAELEDAGAKAVFESVIELCQKLDQTPLR